ncbi:TetR/AcrR family transcriptional regulator [Candidatus Sumerlaeota bacterium]|nr:TetR/AcrR family transcriptional regulator [Candidatus Sumerlaeota bacterium]
MASDPTLMTAAELFGAPEPPKRGRDRLLAIAIDLFYRNGFNSIGIENVIEEAGVSKTTFYKHFSSKSDLMVAAVKWRDRYEQRAWRRAVNLLAGDDPRRQLRAFFEVMDRWFNEPDFRGCLFINAAAEFPNPNDPVHRAAAAHKRSHWQETADMAKAAGADDPEAFADAYMTLFEGALVMRQTHGRDDAARMAMPMVDLLIERHLPSSP